MFEEIGLSTGQLIVVLLLGLGPVRICLSWLFIAHDLNRQEQRQVAWRITWVSIALIAIIIFLGFFTVRAIAPQREYIVIGACIVLIVSTLFQRLPEPVVTDEPPIVRAKRMAIHPLAVPIMINPMGLGLLMIVAAFVRDAGSYISFFALVIGMFLINFVLMLLLGRIKREFPKVIILLFGEIFAILLVSFGIYFIFRSLSNLGLISIDL